MTNLDMLKMFEAVSVLFRASYQEPLWGKYCNHLDNSIDAGCIFLEDMLLSIRVEALPIHLLQ